MHVVTGTDVQGEVILQDASLPEVPVVIVLAKDSQASVCLPPGPQAKRKASLEVADHKGDMSGVELHEELPVYG